VRALFGTPLNAALSVVMLGLFWLLVPPFLRWAVADATWEGLSRKACAPDGACWAFVRGTGSCCSSMAAIPSPSAGVSMLRLHLLALVAAGTLFAPRRRGWWLTALLLGVPVSGTVLLVGGVFGLPYVSTADWGGLLLNVVLAFVVVVGSLPLGILLAFARQSGLPAVRLGSICFIELWRGSPWFHLFHRAMARLAAARSTVYGPDHATDVPAQRREPSTM
jgi:general L-amino acid transport system permease protein